MNSYKITRSCIAAASIVGLVAGCEGEPDTSGIPISSIPFPHVQDFNPEKQSRNNHAGDNLDNFTSREHSPVDFKNTRFIDLGKVSDLPPCHNPDGAINWEILDYYNLDRMFAIGREITAPGSSEKFYQWDIYTIPACYEKGDLNELPDERREDQKNEDEDGNDITGFPIHFGVVVTDSNGFRIFTASGPLENYINFDDPEKLQFNILFGQEENYAFLMEFIKRSDGNLVLRIKKEDDLIFPDDVTLLEISRAVIDSYREGLLFENKKSA